MNGKTSMNIRMDNDVKVEAQKLFSEFGMDMTTAINLFLRQSIREQRIPFEIKLSRPNKETMAAIEEAERLLKTSDTKRYQSVDALFEDLDNDKV